MLDHDPDLYHTTMQRFRWFHDLGRQASGAFHGQVDHPSLEADEVGIALALAYTAPLKTLCITGAPRSKHARDFTLPARLWGTEADIAFLTSKHHPDFYQYGDEEEFHIPFWQLPVRLSYGPEQVRDLPLDMMLKNVRHARCTIRMAAAKALCMNKRYAELEALLSDPDPRLRRAALDGINDNRPWFTAPTVGRHALPADEFTPAMAEAITRMLTDPEEAWFVVDGALNALSHAPVELIEKNIPHILKWTTHEDWWLRESAFNALMGLNEDEKLFTEYLPTAIDIMINEYRYNPRHKMVQQLRKVLDEVDNDSPLGRMLVDGFTRAVGESTILPDVGAYPRSREGATNVVEVAQFTTKFRPLPGVVIMDRHDPHFGNRLAPFPHLLGRRVFLRRARHQHQRRAYRWDQFRFHVALTLPTPISPTSGPPMGFLNGLNRESNYLRQPGVNTRAGAGSRALAAWVARG